MGFKYVAHDSLCGCERCAREWERENPQQVYDRVEDKNYRDDGTHIDEPPLDWDDYEDIDYDD